MEQFKNQVSLFKYIWETRDHKCYVTHQDLNRFENSHLSLSMFAHVLRKSAYPEWRLNPNNIVLLSPNFRSYSVHRLFDDGVCEEIKKFEKLSRKSFRVLFEFERDMHKLYTQEFGKKTPERKVVEKYLESL